jgi:hypothetical protein
MADHLTLLENKLDERFLELSGRIQDKRCVADWADWNFRAGYLEAIREVGQMIKDIRAPENVAAEGIPDVFAQEGEQTNG